MEKNSELERHVLIVDPTIGQNCMQIVTKNKYMTPEIGLPYIFPTKHDEIKYLPSKMSVEQMHSPSSPCSLLVRMVSLEVMKIAKPDSFIFHDTQWYTRV